MLKKFFLVLAGITGGLLLAELTLHVVGLVYLTAQQRRPLRQDRPGTTWRILCLGESTTASPYPRFLEEELNRRFPAQRFEVAGGGIPGVDSDYILKHLDSNLDKYRPDIVVAMMGINDPKYQAAPVSRFSRLEEGSHLLKVWRWLNRSTAARSRPIEAPYPGMPDNPAWEWLEKGRELLRDKEFSRAESWFRKAAGDKDARPYALLDLAWLYHKTSAFGQAEQVLRRALKEYPGGEPAVRYYLSLAVMYHDTGAYDKEKEAAEQALLLNPRALDLASNLRQVYLRKGSRDRAEAIFKRIAPFNRDNDRFFGALAVFYLETKNYRLADHYFDAAERLRKQRSNPRTRENYTQLAETLARRKVTLVCMQYPMRRIQPLKNLLGLGAVFVDNEKVFKNAVKTSSYDDIFADSFAGDFGHCTDAGYRLMAQNIADTLAPLFGGAEH